MEKWFKRERAQQVCVLPSPGSLFSLSLSLGVPAPARCALPVAAAA
eukprot:COSAG01_NODE_1894_length_8959_cov_3.852603_13_plen_46_part_00